MSPAEPMNPARPIKILSHSATAGAVSSCDPFNTASVGVIRLWRPLWSRKSGMYALVAKYTADAIPITAPMRTTWPSRHDGHQRAVVGIVTADRRRGAAITSPTALAATIADHDASAHLQSPPKAGSTPNGVVKTVGMVSPNRIPLLNTAVASVMRAGNHSRTREGNAGWLTATPMPIRKVDANSTGVLGPKPRSAPNTATRPSPMATARRTPSLVISRAPGTAARAKRTTGSDTSAPTAFSSRFRSRWMFGIRGGTASRVSRRSTPASHSRRSRTHSALVSLIGPPRTVHTGPDVRPAHRRGHRAKRRDPREHSVPHRRQRCNAGQGRGRDRVRGRLDRPAQARRQLWRARSRHPAADRPPDQVRCAAGSLLRLKRLR